MSEKFGLKTRRISQEDKAAISGIFASLNDPGARFVQSIPISSIKPFPGHPYRVLDNSDMEDLMGSIKENGVQEPILIWAVTAPWTAPDGSILAQTGDHILISGHRRKRACEKLGLSMIPAILSHYKIEDAQVAMVDANLRREKVLPSEKAFAFKIKYDAMKLRQGKRSDLTSSQLETNIRSDKILSEEVKESRATVRRLMRLTELLPPFLDMVDSGSLGIIPAEAISFLDPAVQPQGHPITPTPLQKPNQALLLKELGKNRTVSMTAAGMLKKESGSGTLPLTAERIREILAFKEDPEKGKKDKETLRDSLENVKSLLRVQKDDEPLEYTIEDLPAEKEGRTPESERSPLYRLERVALFLESYKKPEEPSLFGKYSDLIKRIEAAAKALMSREE